MNDAERAAVAGGYSLLDFGGGRKLERLGPFVLDRPAPAADGLSRADPGSWAGATARFGRGAGGAGEWQPVGALPPSWEIQLAELDLELRPTPSGGIGLFPEQLHLASWLERAVRRCATSRGASAPRVLNLFAHTGLLTLLAARAGAAVAHVDASRPAVAWARLNAARSGLGDRPIRWLVDDALSFARREIRRGRRYDGLILDPPTYGHGPDGVPWKLESGLADLLHATAGLTGRRPMFLCLTGHATGLQPDDLLAAVAAAFGPSVAGAARVDPLRLAAPDGRGLAAGLALRWEAP
jgi:23S rRNA (cytosine1962-C5)-methyltransferase